MADKDPFSALGDPWGEQPKAPGVPKPPAGANPFAEMGDPWGEQTVTAAPEDKQSTGWGAARRAAGRSLLPSIGGLAGFGAGMEAGAIAGSIAGVPGAFVGGLAGGLVGSIGASWATQKVQDAALSKLPETWQDALGQTESQRIADEKAHPIASFLGGAVPYLITMRPGAAEPFLKTLPENASTLQRLMARPETSRLFGAGLMGGMELGQEYAEGDVDWRKVAISSGMGLILNKQTRIGDKIMAPGTAVGRAVMPASWAKRYDAFHAEPTVAQAGDENVAGAGVTEEVFRGTEQRDPDAARNAQNAARTEAVALGEPEIKPDPHDLSRRMDPELWSRADTLDAQIEAFRQEIAQYHNPPESVFAEAEARAQKIQDDLTAHIESSNGYTGGKEARRLRAELRDAQAQLDELKGRQQRYSAGGAEEAPELATVRQHLMDTLRERQDLGREIAASYRRAEEALGGGRSVFPAEATGPQQEGPGKFKSLPEMVAATDGSQRPAGVSGAPEAASTPPEAASPAPIAAPSPDVGIRQQIVDDVKRRLMKAGMKETEAAANAEIWASKYMTRAALFEGKRGTGLDLYRETAPDIAGPNGKITPFEVGPAAAESRIAAPAAIEPKIAGQALSSYASAEQVRELLRNGASVEEISNHPYVKAANARLQAIPTTDKLPGYGTPEFEQNRVLTVDGERHVGYDAGTDALVKKAESYSTHGPVANNRQATIVIGPPAAGKSSISERIAERTHSAIADVDDAKAALPEYQGGIGANATHEESGELGAIVLGKLMDKGANVIIPKVGHSKEGISKLIDRMKGEGYDVHLVNIDVTPENAFTRMIGRFLSTGRLINPEYFNSIGDKPLQTFNALKNDERLTSHANVESNGPPGTQTVSEGAGFAADATRGGRGREVSGAVPEAPPKTGPASGAEPRTPAEPVTETSGNVTGQFAGEWSPPYTAEAVTAERMATVNHAIEISRKLAAMTPEQQLRDVPKFTPETQFEPLAPGENPARGPFMFNATALNVDADRFQFKSGGDEYGVTGALRQVQKWDKAKADQIIVWEDRNGKLWVADGHQRSGLARRLVAEGKADHIEIAGTLLREADGVDASTARAVAAVKNIAAGTGTALDGAKVLRDRPDMIGELNGLSAGKAGQALSLAKLDDEAWRMVINRVVPEHQGAIVGEMIPNDAARQNAAMKEIARFEPRNEEEVRVLVSRVKQAELAKAESGRQASMFDDFESPESTAGEEMKIVAKAIKGLEKDRSLFKRVVANAQRIEQTGSHIEREAAKATVEDAGIFAKQLASDAYAKGPVRDALVDAARGLKNGDIRIGEAVEQVLSALRRQAEERDAAGAGAASGRTAGQEGAGGEGGEREYSQVQRHENQDLASEPGAEGLPQTLIPGVEPIKPKTDIDRLRERAAAPMRGGNAPLPDTGLFGERRQGDLFDTPRQKEIASIPGIHLKGAGGQRDLFQIQAFHGSPHDFDQFSLGKIGTGEGAQAYGHGLYFAEKKGVAEGYKRKLSDATGDKVKPDEVATQKYIGEWNNTLAKINEISPNRETWKLPPDKKQEIDDLYAKLDDIHAKMVADTIERNPHLLEGRLYQVRINADPAHFLDWDKPLSQQPASVRKLFGDAGPPERPTDAAISSMVRRAMRQDEDVRNVALTIDNDSALYHEAMSHAKRRDPAAFEKIENGEMSPGEYVEQNAKAFIEASAKRDRPLGDFYKNMEREKGPEATQAALREAGVPGIKYLDAGSRADGDGSRNYVVFDDKLIEITHKNGKPVTGVEAEQAKADVAAHAQENPGAGSRAPELPSVAPEEGQALEQRAAGKIRIAPGRRSLITLAEKADASTFMHESGHQWLEDLMADAMHEHAPGQLKDDADTVLKWLGVKSAEDIKVRHHEKFARGFEQYLREGVAPSAGLAHVFQQFKNWLTAIYQTLKGLGRPISEDIRGVFDRMLAETPERTVLAEPKEAAPTLPAQHEAAAASVHPADADAYADRVKSEAERALAEHHPEVANEAQAAVEGARQERAAAGRADQPAGEAGGGNAKPSGLAGGSAEAGPQPGGNASGAQHGAELRGGGAAAAEGAGLRSGADDRSGAGAGLGNAPFAPRPTERIDARESPFVDKAGNIRVDNLTTSKDVAQAIHDSAEANKDFVADRRGVVTDGQVMDLADALGMKYTDLLQRKIGQAFNAEQVMAARKLLVQSATEVAAAMKKAASGTDADVLAYAQARDRHHMIQGQVAGITAEAGRALRAFRDISMPADAAAADAMVRQATGRTLFQLRMEAQLGMALETPEQVSAFMRASQQHSFPRMVLEYWINGLISGPATHVTYIVGNNVLSLWKAIPETAAAAAIGQVRKSMGREGETVQFGEVGAGMKAKWQSRPAAIQAAIESFRTGQNAVLPGEKIHQSQGFGPDYEFAPRWEIDPNAKYSDAMASAFGALRGVRDGFTSAAGLLKAGGIEGAPAVGWNYSNLGAIPDLAVKGVTVLPLGTAARLPSRFVAAIHSYFKAMNYSIDIAAQSYRTASAERLEGEAFNARVADLRQNPTNEMMQNAVPEALNATLMATGGEFTKRLSALTNYETSSGFKPLKFIDPFVHISSNIINEALLKRTPVGLLSAELRKDLGGVNGTIAQDKAMARMLVGTATAVGAGFLAAEGYLSGSGPSDRNEAAVWRLAGNQAHSVRIGDVWYDIHKLGPLGLLMSTAADLFEVSHIVSEGDLSEAAAHLHHAFIHNILDESFMRGPADLIKAIEDPQRFGTSYVNNTLSSFLPYSVGQAQIARAMDPYSRQARTFMDSLLVKIPGLSENVLPRRDIWGEPIQGRQVLGIPGASAIWASEVSKDPVNLALLDLGIGIAPVQKKIRNVELTPDQLDDFQRIAGRTAKMRLDTIVNSAQWQQWPDHVREQVVREAVKQAREVARGTMMMKYPQIMRDAVAAKREAMSGGVPASARGM